MSVARENSLRSGMGSLGDVADALCNLPETEASKVQTIRTIGSLLTQMDDYADGGSVIAAMLCAVCNSHFRTTGMLWRASDKGLPVYEYISSTTGRDGIADLMGV